MNLSDHLASLLTAIVTPLVFWWLARKFPARQLTTEGPSLDRLRPLYWKWELAFTIIYLVLWLPVTALIYAPLHLLAQWRTRAMQSDASTFVFYADGAAIGLPAFFMALLLSAYLLLILSKRLLKARYSEYDRYVELRFGFDQNRVLRFFGIAITALFVTTVWMVFDWYAVASPNGLRVNSLLGRHRQYRYTDISEIVTAPAFTAPNGKTVERRVYLVKFKDEYVFSTESLPPDEVLERSSSALMHALVERSGVKPNEKAVFQRGEVGRF